MRYSLPSYRPYLHDTQHRAVSPPVHCSRAKEYHLCSICGSHRQDDGIGSNATFKSGTGGLFIPVPLLFAKTHGTSTMANSLQGAPRNVHVCLSATRPQLVKAAKLLALAIVTLLHAFALALTGITPSSPHWHSPGCADAFLVYLSA